MNWFGPESFAGTPLDGYHEAFALWVQTLAKEHVGFIPDMFPDHFYITTSYADDDEEFVWVSLFPLALWKPPQPIREDDAEIVFELENMGDAWDLIVAAKPGIKIQATEMAKTLLKFRLSA